MAKASTVNHRVFTDDITDYQGRIRLCRLRDYFKWGQLETEEGRRIIAECFEEWVNCNEYLWFAVRNWHSGEKIAEVCRKCAKRGNDVYRWRLKKRLEWVDEFGEKEFFSPRNRDVRGKTTKMLFVSLTYDTKRCSRREAWENVGREWNRWISAVRRRYGTVKHFRNFEAHKNGYPHVHAVLIFSDHEFEVSHRDKKGRFRILRKSKDWFGEKWHSFVDVQACYSTEAFGYVKKYLLKVHGGDDETGTVTSVSKKQGRLTLSLLWLFRKQSFSLSGGMRELICDLIQEMHNSNVFPFQMTLEGKSLYMFELIGVVTLEELSLKRKPPPDADKKWTFTVLSRSSAVV